MLDNLACALEAFRQQRWTLVDGMRQQNRLDFLGAAFATHAARKLLAKVQRQHDDAASRANPGQLEMPQNSPCK